MKKKLMLKRYNNCYALNDYREPSKGYPLVIAHSDDEHFRYKLSKQNCDEIFGIVDIHKLAIENTGDIRAYNYFKAGYNKAMELNKDKVFIEHELRCALEFGYSCGKVNSKLNHEYFIGTLQQPTEIEVEIKMEDSIGVSDKYTPDNKPKLDSQGCLILKKI